MSNDKLIKKTLENAKTIAMVGVSSIKKEVEKCGLLPHPGGPGGSAREVKKPHCFFGALKRVKNGKKNT